MKGKVLFITDESVNHPVLRSQGLPMLLHLTSKGLECHVVSFEYGSLPEFRSHDLLRKIIVHPIAIVRRRWLPDWLVKLFKGMSECWHVVRQERIEVIHARSFGPSVIAVALKTFVRPKAKFICDFRGVFVDEQIYLGHWKEKSWKAALARRLEFLNLLRADKIIVVSKAMRAHLETLYGGTIPGLHSKIHVIPNKTAIHANPGISTSTALPRKRSLGIYSGSSASWQSIPELIRFCKRALQKYSTISFAILTYEDKEKFRRYFLGEDELLRSIEIITLPPEEVAASLASGDFGILLRDRHIVNRVASPLKFAEYLANGLAVLVSEGIGDTEAIISHHRVGVVVRDQNYDTALDALAELLKDPGLSQRCREVAAREFNVDDANAAYASVYSELLETK